MLANALIKVSALHAGETLKSAVHLVRDASGDVKEVDTKYAGSGGDILGPCEAADVFEITTSRGRVIFGTVNSAGKLVMLPGRREAEQEACK